MKRRIQRMVFTSTSQPKLLFLVLFVFVFIIIVNFRQLQIMSDFLVNVENIFYKGEPESPEERANYISDFLDVQWTVKENLDTYAKHLIKLKNKGQYNISHTDWKIYFHHIRILEPTMEMVDDRFTHNALLGQSGMRLSHVSGLLFYIYPDEKLFEPLRPDHTLIIPVTSSEFQLSRTDVFPNWYVVIPGAKPKIMLSTSGESLDFVTSFDLPQQWKMGKNDEHNPYTAFDRYNLSHDTEDLKRRGKFIIPTPEVIVHISSKPLVFNPSEWSILNSDEFPAETNYLSEKLGVKITSETLQIKFIQFVKGQTTFSNGDQQELEEAYELRIDANKDQIQITASTGHGIFNGIQSLLNLDDPTSGSGSRTFPSLHVKDRPRFTYRGYMLDVSRNFHKKETIFKLLDMMAMYKLNKFHFHLTDDDGWRIEIPDIPELTQLGSNRCHDESETVCLMPSLGSGPFKNQLGSGFYTIKDYKEILQHATRLHIQVVPEIDMPSHMRAAMKSVLLRQQRFGDQIDPYKMTDKKDGNNYRNGQGFNDDSVNPCREGLYTFLNKILETLMEVHKDIQPLTLYHFGGDEVPERALDDMQCDFDKTEIKQHFIKRVVSNTKYNTLSYGAWEDGILQEHTYPYPLKNLTEGKRDLYAFVWTEKSKALFRVANAGYKVVNCRGASLYFDYPYEPDPDERGFYWITRFIDTRMVFQFNPLSGKEGYGPLEKPENIVGMQAQLWSELIRNTEQLDYMTFPRLQALAERAWHRALWEKTGNELDMKKDWIDFVNTLGYREFPRMEKLGVRYRLPPPGAIIKEGKLLVKTIFPGLEVEYSPDVIGKAREWSIVKGGEVITESIVLRTRSPPGIVNSVRYSREVKLQH